MEKVNTNWSKQDTFCVSTFTAGMENQRKSASGPKSLSFNVGDGNIPMFVELQQLVPRVHGGLHFGEDVFSAPRDAHLRVVWLQIARWINFEQNYNKVEQRFTEPHVSPMKFSRIAQLCEQIKTHGKVLRTNAATLGQALDEVSCHARDSSCVNSQEELDVLRAVLLAERWHPEVKGCISDVAEFDRYWENADPVGINMVEKARRASTRCTTIQMHRQTHHPYYRYNHLITSTLDPESEACAVLCGTVEFLQKPIIVLVRLNNCIEQSCISEVNVPVRYLFVYLGPPPAGLKYDKLARVFAVMMGDTHFCSRIRDAYAADDILDAVDIFMNKALVMPISKFASPETLAGMVRQIEAYKRELEQDSGGDQTDKAALIPSHSKETDLRSMDLSARKVSAISIALNDSALRELERKRISSIGVTKVRKKCMSSFCPPFVDLARGFKPWLRRMPSDYTDAFNKDHLATVLGSVPFLYFVNLAPTITFAALLHAQVDRSFTISSTLLSSGICMVLFTIFSGQPLGFVGTTAPMFILECAIASVAKDAPVDLKLLRFWTAIYCAMFGVLFVALNISALINHVRRSLEEIFNTFIAFFFLLKAVFTMFRLIPAGPKDSSTEAQLQFTHKMAIAGATLFLAFIKVHFCLCLANIKRGNYFRRFIRKLLGALNIPLGMLLITALERIFFRNFNLPKVSIPPSDQIDTSQWFGFPDLSGLTNYGKASPGFVHGMSVALGLAMSVIIFTEVGLNGITAMKNKAVKPNIFVMDVILMQIIFPIVNAVVGWPFYSGSTVRTVSNLVALVRMDRAPAPGMSHRVIGTIEQRVSGILVGLLVGLSIFLGSILGHIPLAALYGMFLYIGVMGLQGLQFFLRVLALLKRRKHWEDWECVRGLPGYHILVFASIQFLFIGILILLNILSEFTPITYAGILFPIVLFLYGIFREIILPKWTWMGIYLHQLDRKHKVNSNFGRSTPATGRKFSTAARKSVAVPLSDPAALPSYLETEKESKDMVIPWDADYSEESSDDEEGVFRRPWAI
ncbi:unnamed protein product [Calicophoron daubneyi]|uniref:Anion exchange protein n=1 Tax=Calicophoron daubneyi TaxID=300641 RepID=A0AAV2TZZ3_CALDB